MILNIIYGIIILIGSYVGSFMIFGIYKKNKYLQKIMKDEEFLSEWLTKNNDKNSFSEITSEMEPIGEGYFRNIGITVSSTKEADKGVKILGGLIFCISLVICVFIDNWSFIVCSTGVLLGMISPIGDSGRGNALKDVLSVAHILYKWNRENPSECKEFVVLSHSLNKVYMSVITLPSL